jgi:hypothetical protein
MKTQLLRNAVFAIGLLAVSAAVAQTKPGDVIVNVPFSFVVANHLMQPGRYIVTPAASGVLRIFDSQDLKNQTFVTVQSVEHSLPESPKLVFHRYGDSYFLTQVWNGSGSAGRELPKSKAEKEVASASLNGTTRPKAEIAVLRPDR